MPAKKKQSWFNILTTYLVIAVIGIILLMPIIYMFFAVFKTNEEIFGSISILPKQYNFSNFFEGWKSGGKYTYSTFFKNTFLLVFPVTAFTVASSSLVAYGFARFKFPFKKILLMILISTLMLPNSVIIIPRYTIFAKLNWIDTYLPFYVPAILSCFPFFVFMMVQFLRGVPYELDESTYIDGCGVLRTLVQILLPIMKPALFSVMLFQFIWTYNDYFNPLIFINSVSKYPVSLALRLSLDSESIVNWGKVMGISFVVASPLIFLFFIAQKYFVEGIATTGLKG